MKKNKIKTMNNKMAKNIYIYQQLNTKANKKNRDRSMDTERVLMVPNKRVVWGNG